MDRLTSRFVVDFLIRKAAADGGFACFIAMGDAHSGGIMVQCCDRGIPTAYLERRFGMDGEILWNPVGPSAESSDEERRIYAEKRKRLDPDLWIIELDIANAEQFVVANGSIR